MEVEIFNLHAFFTDNDCIVCFIVCEQSTQILTRLCPEIQNFGSAFDM